MQGDEEGQRAEGWEAASSGRAGFLRARHDEVLQAVGSRKEEGVGRRWTWLSARGVRWDARESASGGGGGPREGGGGGG